MDKHLTWKSHIEKIRSIIKKKVGIIFKLRHILPQTILLLIYKSFIQPHITYGLEVWGSTYPSYLQPILLLQKMVVRAITFSDFTSHSLPLFNKLNLLDIFKLHKLCVSLFMFDLYHDKLPQDLNEYVTLIKHPHETRQKSKGNLYQPKAATTAGQFSITSVGTKIWNEIPIHIRQIKLRDTFKTKFKEFLLQ